MGPRMFLNIGRIFKHFLMNVLVEETDRKTMKSLRPNQMYLIIKWLMHSWTEWTGY